MGESIIISLIDSIFRDLKKKVSFDKQLFCKMGALIYGNRFLGFYCFQRPLKHFIQATWTHVMDKFESG